MHSLPVDKLELNIDYGAGCRD